MTEKTLEERCHAALNKLTKWRVLFTGWQLGTRLKGDPEGDAVRDHREATILLRTELTAITGLLLKKGIFTQEEFQQALIDEAGQLEKDYERRFPGVQAVEDGLRFDHRAIQTMKGWKP